MKRRKLDAPDSNPGSRKAARPVTGLEELSPGVQRHGALQQSEALTDRAKRTYFTQEAWREAKAKRYAAQRKTGARRIDVYDDVDGTHGERTVTPQNSAQPARKKESQLDPLRNQEIEKASPVRQKSSTSTLGFFKQFHTPRKQIESSQRNANKKVTDDSTHRHQIRTEEDATAGVREVNDASISKHGGRVADEAAGGRASEKDGLLFTHSNTEKQGVTPRHGGWHYGAKKTFEDEIRELEAAAREHAEDEEARGSVDATSHKRKRTPRSLFDNSAIVPDWEANTPRDTPRTAGGRASARRKVNRAHNIENSAKPDVESHNPMPSKSSEGDEKRATSFNLTSSSTSAKESYPASQTSSQQALVEERLPQNFVYKPDHLRLIQTLLVQRATGKRPLRLVNLDDEYAKVSALVTQTVTAGESNSMLLIGARGSGKTALVDQILREQQREHPNDFHTVKLNGFIHTDDKIALREIWRQLGRETELDEDNATRNHADTLTTFLALLSHPAELGREQADQTTKSVVFVIDEFELFTGHPRQTLLYNLFDIVQSRKAPIAVLGLTTRIDVAENLEKRVKSRFSHRYVHLSLARSFPAYQDICRSALWLHFSDLNLEERIRLTKCERTEDTPDACSNRHPTGDSVSTWNAMIDSVFASDAFIKHLRRLYHTTKSIPDFMTSMLMSLATMPIDSGTSNAALTDHFISTLPTVSLSAPDSKLDILDSLSTLELALLICAARLNAIYSSETVSFALVYEEFKELASKAKVQASASGALAQGVGARISAKDVAKGAWADLGEHGLIMEDGRGSGRVDVGLEEIGMSGVDLGPWGRWCKEI